MALSRRIIVAAVKGLTRLVCRIDDTQLARVPQQGPLIVVTNHVNILEIPIIYTHLQPRPVTGFVAAYRWGSRLLGWLLDACGAIPLRRGEADLAAMRRGIEMLKAGHILVIAPEGTRSGHGRLQKAHPGVVLLALHSGAPLLPVVYYGGEQCRDNLRRLRRTDFHIVVGKPFTLDAGGVKVTRQVRRQMIDEVMYHMSALLPPAYRGVYSDLNPAAETYLTFHSSLR
jgi:1-acyl-sn-glycerol-3-phosphate acyltransferase